MSRVDLALSLTPLFSALLSACVTGHSSCDSFQGGTYMQTVELTPGEYAEWESGQMPAPTSGPSTTGAGTTGADDTGDAGDKLTPDEVCHAVCLEQSIGGDVTSCKVGAPNPDGNIPIECELPNVCEGRSHACIASRGPSAPTTAAAWLARAAHDEAASVHAFRALVAELTRHAAPEHLLTRLRAAADDEVRHATLIEALAHEHDATVLAPELAEFTGRDLLDIARENAVEGCVHETWAALSAAYQARHAATPRLRAIYRQIAADEARHAELAWALDTWLKRQLDAPAYALVEAARERAVRALRAALAHQPFGPELVTLGLPDPRTAARLAAGLDTALWSAAA